MLTDQHALELLASEADAPEFSRSSYWELERNSYEVTVGGEISGSTVMGIATPRSDSLLTVAHWVLQSPFRWMGRLYSDHTRLQRLGRQIAARQERPYWLDSIRQVLSLALILRYVSLENAEDVTLVIGDGFGIMTSLLLLAFPERRVITVNLTKSLLLDLVSIRKAVPQTNLSLARNAREIEDALARRDTNLIAVRADDAGIIAGAPIDLAINITSMQEMTLPIINNYFDVLRATSSDRVAFFCCNRIQKQLYDGPGPNFHDYPWRPGDQTLSEGVSWWNQVRYSKTPPFWHYRWGKHRTVWQRLALLEKDGA